MNADANANIATADATSKHTIEPVERDNVTAQHVVQLESADENPLRPGTLRTPKYFEYYAERSKLPAMKPEGVIVSAGTGTGKSTQLTQRVMWIELASEKPMICTQPRKLAVREVAARVAAEADVELGVEIGVQYRAFDKTSDKTRLKFVMEGVLLREIQSDATLSKYACVIVDEVHERTTNVVMLIALLKNALKSHPSLKIVILSPALHAQKFADYFGVTDTLNIEEKTYPVQIQYLAEPTSNYLVCALRVVKQIHETQPNGDILLFLTTGKEIEDACSRLRAGTENLHVVPLYAALPKAQQERALSKTDLRRCIVSTNIAETGLTIDGINYVIDSSMCKEAGFNPRVGMHTVLPAPISKAATEQRAARAGQTNPGTCFRLYTEDTFNDLFLETTPPGILNSDMAKEILMLKNIGINAVGRFDFVDPPHPEIYLRGLHDLRAMDYLDEHGAITPAGKSAVMLPIEPAWYNAFREAHELGCLGELISIAALSSAQNSVWLRPRPYRYAADEAHRYFSHPTSDHLAELNALHRYMHKREDGEDLDAWCHDFFLSKEVLEEVLTLRLQLKEECAKLFHIHVDEISWISFGDRDRSTKIQKALARGWYHHSAILQGDVCRTLNNYLAGISLDSSLVGMEWDWLVYHKLEYGAKQCMTRVTAVKLEWLLDLDYFYPANLPKDYHGAVRNKQLREIFEKMGRPPQPPSS